MIPTLKILQVCDIAGVISSLKSNHLPKPLSTFETYLKEQEAGERLVWLAFLENEFAGYVSLIWTSRYPFFKENNIPEIMDLNVLPDLRKKGIGSLLLQTAEEKASEECPMVGIGVGLYKEYGSAQRLYIRRGYIPDGKGVSYHFKPIPAGSQVRLDDDLVLWLTKELNKGF